MEERAWAASQIHITLRATSEGRSWTGFAAQLYDTSGGFAEMPPKTHHRVRMHLSAPIIATCRCAGFVQRRRMSPGDCDVVPLAHSAVWEEDGPATMLGICLMPSLMQTAAEGMDLNPDTVSVEAQLRLRDPRIGHIGRALQLELQGPEPNGRLYADSLGLALAARLLQRYAPIVPPRVYSFSKRRLSAVIDYIHDNLVLDLSLSELAAVAGLSPSRFRILFKEATNQPAHQFVIQCRVEYAMSLLTKRKYSLTEVASLSGFSDQSHMARCMRRVVGVTPAVVKRQHE
ncbi:MAG TPA: AraC family transcriptional regulator [Candidatus Eremiobacteraceae bacterium]